jgi:large subunit ribosomal protein L20
MARVKRALLKRRRKKKIFQQTKGFFSGRRKQLRAAIETLRRGGAFAHRDRRVKKREFRGLFIQRVNAAVREQGLSYSKFIAGLKGAGIEINRKMLAELAINDPTSFGKLVAAAKASMPKQPAPKAPAPKAA